MNAILKKLETVNVALLSKIALLLIVIGSLLDFQYLFASILALNLTEILWALLGFVPLFPCVLFALFHSKLRDKIKLPILLPITFALLALIASRYIMSGSLFFSSFSTCLQSIFLILLPAACVALAVFLIRSKKFYKTTDISILIPVIFSILTFAKIDSLSYSGFPLPLGLNWAEGTFAYDIFLSYLNNWSLPIMAVLYCLSTIYALKGFSRKHTAILATILSCIYLLLSLIERIILFDPSFLWFVYCAYIIGEGLFYFALLCTVLNCQLPVVLKPRVKKEKVLSPEEMLISLNRQFDLGVISEEEYNAQRAEIISKL